MRQPYPVLRSRVDRRSDTFVHNYEANTATLRKVDQALAEARAGGGEKYVNRHLARGKLLPRERIELLLDRDSHFLELCPLAGVTGSPDTRRARASSPASGSCQRRRVHGQRRAESTVKGGAINEFGVTQERAGWQRSPGDNWLPVDLASPSRPAPTCPTSPRSSSAADAGLPRHHPVGPSSRVPDRSVWCSAARPRAGPISRG